MTSLTILTLPLVPLVAGAVLSVAVGRTAGRRGGSIAGLVAVIALSIAFLQLLALSYPPVGPERIMGLGETQLRADGLGVYLGLIATGLGVAVAVYSLAAERRAHGRPAYASLLLLLVAGIVGIGLSGDLFNLYVFFELMALSSYALVAFHRDAMEAVEAGMKYLVMSAAGSLLALLGIGFLYLATGTLDLDLLAQTRLDSGTAAVAASLLIAGFGVKAAVVPLHTWLPDAHAAAPSGISAMLSGVVIQAGLIAMVRSLAVFGVGGTSAISVGILLALLGVVSMTVGNLTAMHQKDVKRMLAYSSVAQMGYILLGVGVGLEYAIPLALTGALFHVLSHALMKGGAFLAAGALQGAWGTRDLDGLRGTGRRLPLAGVPFAIFAVGLAGAPPMVGFPSKLFIASGSAQAGGWLGVFFVVALVANSVLSLSYYVPAISLLFSKAEGQTEPRHVVGRGFLVPIVGMAVLAILFGLWPAPILAAVEPAVRSILGGGPP